MCRHLVTKSIGHHFRITFSHIIFLPVFAPIFALRMSPLERCLSPKLFVMRSDTVPFPEPGGPIMTARNTVRKTILKSSCNSTQKESRVLLTAYSMFQPIQYNRTNSFERRHVGSGRESSHCLAHPLGLCYITDANRRGGGT